MRACFARAKFCDPLLRDCHLPFIAQTDRRSQIHCNTIVSQGSQDTLTTGGTRFIDRANVACDAFNRVTVVYRLKPDNTLWLNDQIAARVFQFDGTKFTPLTPEFFPFVENDQDPSNLAGFLGKEPSVAMTPREILIYAEGTWNATGNPTNAVVTTGTETHCYTIITHPAPLADPVATITAVRSGSNLNLSWNSDAGLYTVESNTTLGPGGWTPVTSGNVATPVSVPLSLVGNKFLRLHRSY
jgi:hypothetical protein